MHSPYELELSEKGDYTFLTTQGTRYRIALHKTEKSYFANYPDIKSFDISFSIEGNKKPTDSEPERVSLTIADTVKRLLIQGYIITFSCETADNKHKGRYRLFDQWFTKYGDSNFKKYDSHKLDDGEKTYYVSLLFDMRKHDSQSINKYFQDSIDEYASYKNT